MSSLCIFELKEHNLSFEDNNRLAKELIKISLANDVAVTFNDDYWQTLIATAGLKDYFTVSSSFLYKDCDFSGNASLFEIDDIIDEICGERNSCCYIEKEDDLFYRKVMKKYGFLCEIIDCIFMYDVNKINLYLSDCGCGITGPEDFYIVKTDAANFMEELYNAITDELNNKFNYRFSDTKFEITKKSNKQQPGIEV